MAKKEECTVCKKAKTGGYAGEIKCSFYGRKPQFDGNSCTAFISANSLNQDSPTNVVGENGVDYSNLFVIENDEFDGIHRVTSRYYLEESNTQIEQSTVKHKPSIRICHITREAESTFFINLETSSLCSQCKGMIISINDSETVKINCNKNDVHDFVLEEEQFLKCCNANKLEFKIFYQKGDPIVISGTKDEEEVLIDTFQSLYSFVVDGTVFPNAGKKAQKWWENKKKEIQELENRAKMKEKENAEKEQKRKNIKTLGTSVIILGALLCGMIIFFFKNLTVLLTLLISGGVLMVIGIIICLVVADPEDRLPDIKETYITTDFGNSKMTYKIQ